MHAVTTKLETSSARRLTPAVALAAVVLLLLGFTEQSFAAHSAPKTFPSASAACHALHQAVQNNDEQALEAILGVGKRLTSGSDEAQNKRDRELFDKKYGEMHRLVVEPDGSAVLYVGAENWPFPIPLVRRHGRWSFDSKTGAEEIVFRRIGENEATAIQLCRDLAASSAKSGESSQAALPNEPFHGYYFRALAGAASASQAGKKMSGLAYVAYPAAYRSSGVMTFIVNGNGEVYEHDLGPNTARLARQMKHWPASGWEAVK